MNRRDVVFASLAIGSLPSPAWTQQTGKASRIGVLLPWDGPTPGDKLYIESERPLYRSLGWVEGQNLFVERRWAGTDPRRWREVAAEFKALRVALIVTMGTGAIRAAHDGAPGVPIVMVAAADPVGAGFVTSLAHPGGDLTGTSGVGEEMFGKQLELLVALAPGVKRIGVLMNPSNPGYGFFYQAMALRARSLGVELDRHDVSTLEELEPALSRARGSALLVVLDPIYLDQGARLAELTLRFRIPSMHSDRYYADAGGLMSLSSRVEWHWHKAASFIDRILRGAKPGDLPIEQPTEFELVINLKTANALGLTVPQSVLLRADEVIR